MRVLNLRNRSWQDNALRNWVSSTVRHGDITDHRRIFQATIDDFE